jgi:phosphoserine aminotransferase
MPQTIHNFSAGPAALPKPVLLKAQSEMLNFQASSRSVMELSHRSPEFAKIHASAIAALTALLAIPPTHAVLFMQGGATLQFSSVYLNLAASPVDYCVSGAWGKKAAKEASLLGGDVNTIFDTDNTIPPVSEWGAFSKDPSYIFYVSNETIVCSL